MPWEVVERCDGFKVVKVPATDTQTVKYAAAFNRRPNTPLRNTPEEAKEDGKAVVAETRARMQLDQQQARSRKAQKRNVVASPGGPIRAPFVLPASYGSTEGQPVRHQRSTAAAGGRAVVSSSAAAAQVAAGAAAEGKCGPLTGNLVRLKVCYNACLPGKQLLLGKLIGSSGCADVYEGSAVVVDSNGDLQAGEVAAAAAAAAAAGTVQLSSISSFAVKVSRVSTPGVDCSTPSSRTARELHALKVLRGHPLAVQLAAEGRLVCHGNCSAAGDSEIPASSSQTASANTDAGHVSRSMLAAGTASWSAGSSPQTVSCIVMELAQMSLQEMLQRTGRCSEPHAGFVAMQLLKLLQIVQSGELGCTLVHGDITPGNVLVFADGRVALADFGVCQITKSTAAAAAAPPEMHTSVGTAYYAAVDACGSSGAAIADPVPHSSSAAAAAAAGIASADGGQGDKHGSSSSSSSSSEDDRHGYDASVDVFGVGVLVLEMLIGDLDGLFQHGPLDLSQLLLSQEQLGRVVDGEVPLPYGVVASAGALQFIGCCCGVGRKREAAAARGKPKRLTPAQLMASSPWLRYGAS